MDSKEQKIALLKNEIRLDVIFQIIWSHRRTFILPVVVTGILTAALSLCIPRYYVSTVRLAPEYSSSMSTGGSLGSLASMVGINVGNLGQEDAIIPMFYADVIQTNEFLVPLLKVKVNTSDGDFEGSIKDYFTKKQKSPFWSRWFNAIKRIVKRDDADQSNGKEVIDPFRLTKKQDDLIKNVGSSIICSYDKKTEVITISTNTQDALVSALFADSVKSHLQKFITEYRTNKARCDLKHIDELLINARKEYTNAQQEYAAFVDTHVDVSLQSFKNKEEELENTMQLTFNAVSALQQQRQLAEAKVLEQTPAFTTLQAATVPVKHAGPKRMITTIAMAMLAFLATALYYILEYVVRKPKETDEE